MATNIKIIPANDLIKATVEGVCVLNPNFSVHNAKFLVESGNGGILGSKLSNGE